jgi:shikimate dehydrogenase
LVDLKSLFADVPADHKRYGVIGFPLGHTLSPAMHGAALERFHEKAVYRAIPLPPEAWDDFRRQARELPLDGFNVTVPHKERIAGSFGLTALDAALHTHAVNTVVRHGDAWHGFNTDGQGFLDDLAAQGVMLDGKKVAILGAGGSARGILVALFLARRRPASIAIINRSAERGRLLVSDMKKARQAITPGENGALALVEGPARETAVREADVVINSTAVGLEPGGRHEIDFAWLGAGQFVYDLIYHRETELMAAARAAGARVSGGLGMLVRQGALAYKIWFGVLPPYELMAEAARQALERQQRSST